VPLGWQVEPPLELPEDDEVVAEVEVLPVVVVPEEPELLPMDELVVTTEEPLLEPVDVVPRVLELLPAPEDDPPELEPAVSWQIESPPQIWPEGQTPSGQGNGTWER
jgi:hypothetical protein